MPRTKQEIFLEIYNTYSSLEGISPHDDDLVYEQPEVDEIKEKCVEYNNVADELLQEWYDERFDKLRKDLLLFPQDKIALGYLKEYYDFIDEVFFAHDKEVSNAKNR